MLQAVEDRIRFSASFDPSISKDMLNKAIRILKGEPENFVAVFKFKEAAKFLGMSIKTLRYYVSRGYIDRVYGGGQRAIGVSRESVYNFVKRVPESVLKKLKSV